VLGERISLGQVKMARLRSKKSLEDVMDPTWMPIISGFIGGAVITIVATFVIAKWQKQRKELSYRIEVRPYVASEEPETPGTSWDPNVKVFYGEREVSQLFPFKIIFRNTGNQTLENLRIKIEPNHQAEILNLRVGRHQRVEVGNINYNHSDPELWEIQVDFLNENDELETYGIGTSTTDNFELIIKVPQPGVKVRERPEFWNSKEALNRAIEILMKTAIRPYL
jgi:hypothetical protein